MMSTPSNKPEPNSMRNLRDLANRDVALFEALLAVRAEDTARVVAAGLDHARLMTRLNRPLGYVQNGRFVLAKTHNCCTKAGVDGAHRGCSDNGRAAYEHGKSAEHVAAMFRLPENYAPAVSAVGHLLHRAQLSHRLPVDVDDSGLMGELTAALNNSWRRKYRMTVAEPKPGSMEEQRLLDGKKPSAIIFAERVAACQAKSRQSRLPSPAVDFGYAYTPAMQMRMAPSPALGMR